MHKRLFEAVAALLAGSLLCGAASPSAAVSQPYLRLIPGVPAAGYFNITNVGHDPLVLTGAQSSDCGMIMMHRSSTAGGMARMDDVSSVTIARGQRVVFAPGGYHLMCMAASPRLRAGGTMKITLTFGNGTTSDVTFHVVNARGQGAR
ncbi:MAG: copper chaperone PCu(A)C [Alphaproteobacteria bacterium]|nr:copper chaperone PCu(A)C [Alphaproteobacteria bacterium]MBL6939115.1 copper chaperone PCu(A)C [Alphaproteobacteria bacterium]MBL7096632.1 copper chaperone PCu(A)C [Alphaproteobacteria bacterium]